MDTKKREAPSLEAFKVVIPSARSQNLRSCVASILSKEPLNPERIIVVDDGARAGYQDAPVTWVPGIKPFVFSRNVNLGIRYARCDIILMNDDAALKTNAGFSRLSRFAGQSSDIGVCSAAVEGFIGNPEQKPRAGAPLYRPVTRTAAFVCVYIPWRVFELVGGLDERFVGYGRDDVEYCDRVRKASLEIGVFEGCVVHHGAVPSTFRTKPDISNLTQINVKLYEEMKRGRRGGSSC